MIFSDLHAHTTFCDGKNTPEEMVLAAIERELKEIGLCVHSYTDFDNSYCIPKNRVEEFQKEMARLKVKYADKIKVLCGVEQDVYSTFPTTGFDYVIGSVHYFKIGEEYFDVDRSKDYLVKLVNERFNGDYYSAAENYFNAVKKVADMSADIVGHFDLITKFNQDDGLFSTKHPRYVAAYTDALEYLTKKQGRVFELNIGGILRGYRKEPYPDENMRALIKVRGGRLVISSDSHKKETVGANFSEWEYLL
jgi:histidinol-phosphatase (PHP family)